MIYLPKAAGALALLAADEGARYSMTGVRIQELADGFFRLEATDGRVLGIVRGESQPSADDEKWAKHLPAPEGFLTEALLDARHLQAAFKNIPKASLGCENNLGVMLARPDVLLLAGSQIQRLPPLDGRYPNVDAVIPKEGAPVGFTLDPDLMIDILKAAKAIAATTGDGNLRVEVLYWGYGQPIGITARGANGLTFDGMIMPLTDDRKSPAAT